MSLALLSLSLVVASAATVSLEVSPRTPCIDEVRLIAGLTANGIEVVARSKYRIRIAAKQGAVVVDGETNGRRLHRSVTMAGECGPVERMVLTLIRAWVTTAVPDVTEELRGDSPAEPSSAMTSRPGRAPDAAAPASQRSTSAPRPPPPPEILAPGPEAPVPSAATGTTQPSTTSTATTSTPTTFTETPPGPPALEPPPLLPVARPASLTPSTSPPFAPLLDQTQPARPAPHEEPPAARAFIATDVLAPTEAGAQPTGTPPAALPPPTRTTASRAGPTTRTTAALVLADCSGTLEVGHFAPWRGRRRAHCRASPLGRARSGRGLAAVGAGGRRWAAGSPLREGRPSENHGFASVGDAVGPGDVLAGALDAGPVGRTARHPSRRERDGRVCTHPRRAARPGRRRRCRSAPAPHWPAARRAAPAGWRPRLDRASWGRGRGNHSESLAS
jgi:hypothetical protein